MKETSSIATTLYLSANVRWARQEVYLGTWQQGGKSRRKCNKGMIKNQARIPPSFFLSRAYDRDLSYVYQTGSIQSLTFHCTVLYSLPFAVRSSSICIVVGVFMPIVCNIYYVYTKSQFHPLSSLAILSSAANSSVPFHIFFSSSISTEEMKLFSLLLLQYTYIEASLSL